MKFAAAPLVALIAVATAAPKKEPCPDCVAGIFCPDCTAIADMGLLQACLHECHRQRPTCGPGTVLDPATSTCVVAPVAAAPTVDGEPKGRLAVHQVPPAGRPFKRGQPAKALHFMHVTKTGGTSLEEQGLAAGLAFGQHDKETGVSTGPSTWHLCSKYQPRCSKRKTHCFRNAYPNFDWFYVVREPCERVFSTAHYLHRPGGHSKWIKLTPQEQDNFIIHQMNCRVDAVTKRFYTMGHYLDQACYANKDLDASATVHVLRFEHLATQFSQLMAEYGHANVTLELHHNQGAAVRHREWLRAHPGQKRSNPLARTPQSLTPELIEAIDAAYGEDFAMYNYTTCLGADWAELKKKARADPVAAARRQREAREAVCNEKLVLNSTSNEDIFAWCTAPDCQERMGAKH